MVEAITPRRSAPQPAARASDKPKTATAMPTHAPEAPDRHETPAQMNAAEMNAFDCRLSIVCALLQLLTLNLDSELSEGATRSGDVMGVLQHADDLLNGIHEDISNIVGVLPDNLRWRTFEAKAIVAVARRMTDDDGWHCKSYDSTMLVWCFDAAGDALKRALHAFRQMETVHA